LPDQEYVNPQGERLVVEWKTAAAEESLEDLGTRLAVLAATGYTAHEVMRKMAEGQAALYRTLTRPGLCMDFDRMGLEAVGMTWHFPTWSPRRRPYDWMHDGC
jgi:hypothetical protein